MGKEASKTGSKHNEGSIEFKMGQWNEVGNLRTLSRMSEWGVKELSFYGNKRTQMVKDISHINFTALTYLVMNGNEIDSIEGLSRVSMPLLQTLFLAINNIREVTDARKAHWPSLKTLNIYYNYIHGHHIFTQAHFPRLERAWVCAVDGKKDLMVHPFFPAKLETCSLTSLCTHAFIKGSLIDSPPEGPSIQSLSVDGLLSVFNDPHIIYSSQKSVVQNLSIKLNDFKFQPTQSSSKEKYFFLSKCLYDLAQKTAKQFFVGNFFEDEVETPKTKEKIKCFVMMIMLRGKEKQRR